MGTSGRDRAVDDQKALVGRNGIDYGSSPIPAEMAHDNLGGTCCRPKVVVGDRNVLVLERHANDIDPITWSLWVGTFRAVTRSRVSRWWPSPLRGLAACG